MYTNKFLIKLLALFIMSNIIIIANSKTIILNNTATAKEIKIALSFRDPIGGKDFNGKMTIPPGYSAQIPNFPNQGMVYVKGVAVAGVSSNNLILSTGCIGNLSKITSEKTYYFNVTSNDPLFKKATLSCGCCDSISSCDSCVASANPCATECACSTYSCPDDRCSNDCIKGNIARNNQLKLKIKIAKLSSKQTKA
jgi:hypothetical protein